MLPWTGERLRDPAGVRVEEAEAAVVRELFTQYLEPGGSLAGLAKHLYALGVPTPTGKRFLARRMVGWGVGLMSRLWQALAGKSHVRPGLSARVVDTSNYPPNTS